MTRENSDNVPTAPYRIQSKYKDGLFRMLFSDKEGALELYNALNHSSYTDPEELEITTIEDVIYMGIKNDVSFLIEARMNLYEAQSSWCPRVCLKIAFRQLCLPLCGRFRPNEGGIVGYVD